jgi:hypothetical protein
MTDEQKSTRDKAIHIPLYIIMLHMSPKLIVKVEHFKHFYTGITIKCFLLLSYMNKSIACLNLMQLFCLYLCSYPLFIQFFGTSSTEHNCDNDKQLQLHFY